LDWTGVDSIKKERWLKTRPCQPSYQIFPGTIPEEHSKWVNELQYSIPQDLLEEIRHCSLRAEEEWGRRKPETRWEPIPTRGPAASYVFSAFTLVADCLYNPETDNYSRDDKKILVPNILAYRFWSFQTKPDNLALYSGLFDLKAHPRSNNFIDFIVDLDLHTDLLREKNVPNKIIPNASLKDVIDYKRPSAFIKNLTVLRLHLLKPKIIRTSVGFILTAEFEGDIKEALNIVNLNHKFTFFIKEENYTVVAQRARICSIGGTPPPTITIEINKLEVQKPGSFVEHIKVIKDSDDWRGDETSVKKVDVNRIKEIRDEDLKANEDFKEIDMKSTNNIYNSICLRPKNPK
jgi:hypothetical protein